MKSKTVLLTLMCCIPLVVPGCGQKPEPAGTPAASNGPVVSGETDVSGALRDLTQAVRKYSVERRQKPKTFSEVVAAGYVQNLPEAPPGKRFEIDQKTMQVVLVKK